MLLRLKSAIGEERTSYVGWAERSDTQQPLKRSEVLGIATVSPAYGFALLVRSSPTANRGKHASDAGGPRPALGPALPRHRRRQAQVDIGFGSSAYALDWNWADGSPYDLGGGDTSGGVGHLRSKSNAGRIVYNMLGTTCTMGCANGYVGVSGPAINR